VDKDKLLRGGMRVLFPMLRGVGNRVENKELQILLVPETGITVTAQ